MVELVVQQIITNQTHLKRSMRFRVFAFNAEYVKGFEVHGKTVKKEPYTDIKSVLY